jgi:hypothetical protein
VHTIRGSSPPRGRKKANSTLLLISPWVSAPKRMGRCSGRGPPIQNDRMAVEADSLGRARMALWAWTNNIWVCTWRVREEGGKGGLLLCPGDLFAGASRGSTGPKVHGGATCCCIVQAHVEAGMEALIRMGLHAPHSLCVKACAASHQTPYPSSPTPKLFLLVTLPTLVCFPGAAAAGRRPTLGATTRSAAGAAATVSCTRRG